MALRSFPRASTALRSSARTSATPAASINRCSAHIQRRWKSGDDKKKGDTPFNYQLMETISKRVEREKAEQMELQYHQFGTARGRFFTTVARKNAVLVQPRRENKSS